MPRLSRPTPALRWRASAISTPRAGGGGRQARQPRNGHRRRGQLAPPLKPDVFCFCTLPNLRSDMIERASRAGRRLIAFEKPVALTTQRGLRDEATCCDASGVKAVVSHQHRYGEHYRQGEGDHRQRRAGPRAHGLRHGHRLDDAHALAPDRLHALVQRRTPSRSG